MPSAIRVIDDITELGASGFNADEYAKWNGSVFVGDTPAGGGSPGGNDKQIQFNNAAAFGGAAGFEYQSGASPNVSLQAQNAAYVPLLVKAAASQSANIQEWQTSDGTVRTSILPGGHLFANADQATAIGFLVKAGSGSPANKVVEFQLSNASTIFSMDKNGDVYFPYANTDIYIGPTNVNHFHLSPSTIFFKSGAGTTYGRFYIGTDRGGGGAAMFNGAAGRPFQLGAGDNYGIEIRDAIITESAAAVPIIIKGAASQSANLQDWTNSSDTVMLSVQADGDLEFDDGVDIVLDTTTGTMLGTATAQKLGFWGATPVVQQVLATGGGATVDNVISLLQTLGLCKQS